MHRLYVYYYYYLLEKNYHRIDELLIAKNIKENLRKKRKFRYINNLHN